MKLVRTMKIHTNHKHKSSSKMKAVPELSYLKYKFITLRIKNSKPCGLSYSRQSHLAWLQIHKQEEETMKLVWYKVIHDVPVLWAVLDQLGLPVTIHCVVSFRAWQQRLNRKNKLPDRDKDGMSYEWGQERKVSTIMNRIRPGRAAAGPQRRPSPAGIPPSRPIQPPLLFFGVSGCRWKKNTGMGASEAWAPLTYNLSVIIT